MTAITIAPIAKIIDTKAKTIALTIVVRAVTIADIITITIATTAWTILTVAKTVTTRASLNVQHEVKL